MIVSPSVPQVGGTDTGSIQSEASWSHGEVTGLCAELRHVADNQLPLPFSSLFSVTVISSCFGEDPITVTAHGESSWWSSRVRGVCGPHRSCSAAPHVTLVWRLLCTCHGAGEYSARASVAGSLLQGVAPLAQVSVAGSLLQGVAPLALGLAFFSRSTV